MAAAGALRSGGAGSPSGGNAKYRELLDRLAETVFEFDVEGRLVYVNHASFEIFGYTPEDFAHGHLSVYDMVVPEEHDRLRANIGRRLEQGATEGFQYTARRKDGSTFPALVQTIVVTCDGRPVGVQGYLIDISRRASIEAALRQRIPGSWSR